MVAGLAEQCRSTGPPSFWTADSGSEIKEGAKSTREQFPCAKGRENGREGERERRVH